MKDRKRNQIFNYLYVLAIIMVIDDHTGSRIGILTSIFPYNSFYMPLFVFISGYFYKKSRIIDNVKHKVKKLFIPYLIWNVIALILSFLVDYIFGTNWLKPYPVKKFFLTNFLTGSTTSLNGAAWFALMLFWVSIIYNIIHSKIKNNKVTDILTTIMYISLGMAAIYISKMGIHINTEWWLFTLRTSFYLQFYHLGYMFKTYFEKPLLKQNKLIVCGLCVVINLVLISLFGYKINFVTTVNMNSFNSCFLPIITSITGIVFYYEVMEFLSRKIGERKLIDFIARNTFTIMQIHLLFVNIPNFYIYYKIKHGSTMFEGFEIEQFIDNAWVKYSPNARLIGFVCGLLGSLLIAYIIEKVKNIKKRGI